MGFIKYVEEYKYSWYKNRELFILSYVQILSNITWAEMWI